MNFSLPTGALAVRGDSFFDIVRHFCGVEVLELLRFQCIESSLDLLEIDDVFSILQFESIQTVSLKELIWISSRDELGNYLFFVLPGIRLKLVKLIRSLRALLPTSECSPPASFANPLTIPSSLLKQYPFLVDLVYCLESNLLTEFSIECISNMIANWACGKNLYRFEQSVKDFAASVFILGGRNVYEFIRLNIPGLFPSLTTLRSTLTSSKHHLVEGEFQYERLTKFVNRFGCKYAFCGEDSTSVVARVSYDTLSNSFVGFTLPLNNGLPSSRSFSTDSLNQLELWHSDFDKSSLIHIHVIQALCPDNRTPLPPPFLLAAYGTNGKYTAQDIVNRWSFIFNSCMMRNIRIVGFAADCDPKNLKAMRDSMGFFSNEETGFEDDSNCMKISSFQVRPCRLHVDIDTALDSKNHTFSP